MTMHPYRIDRFSKPSVTKQLEKEAYGRVNCNINCLGVNVVGLGAN